MRTGLLAIGLLTLVPAAGRADDAATVVERAVTATAGSDIRLRRLDAVVRTERGSFFQPAGELPTRRIAYLALPDRIKYDATITVGGQPQSVVLAVDGVHGWKRMTGVIQDMASAEYDSVKTDLDDWSLITLLPLRRKDATLKSLPAATVGGKPAAAVSVTRPSRPDAQLYFAADTGLLVRVRFKLPEAGPNATRDVDLGEYREFDGIKLPTRIIVTRNGKKTEEWTVEGYQTPDRLDDKAFKKP
ncbi:MAG TPA: hypothetical protein VGF55_15320 [Gemmataceae bacterium]|jgi:hypothetical protein